MNLNSSTTLLDCSYGHDSNSTGPLLRYGVPILFGIVDIIGFIGNLLVIIVIICYANMRNSTNILIVSLAFADLSFIIVCVPLTAMVYATTMWPLPEMVCKTYLFLSYFSIYCSVYTLVLMCVDRFLAVVFPLQSRTWRTTKNTTIMVIMVWIIIICATSPIFFNSKVLYTVYPGSSNSCRKGICQNGWLFEYNDHNEIIGFLIHRSRVFFGLFFFMGYAIPLTAICIFYSILICELLCGKTSRMSKSREARKSKKKATKVVIVVVLVFAVCWLPIQIVFLLQNIMDENNSLAFRMAHIIGNILAYANSSVNPILYAFCCENFRTGFAALLCLDREKLQQIHETSTMYPRPSDATYISREILKSPSPVERNKVNNKQPQISKSAKFVTFVENTHPLSDQGTSRDYMNCSEFRDVIHA